MTRDQLWHGATPGQIRDAFRIAQIMADPDTAFCDAFYAELQLMHEQNKSTDT